MCQKKGFFLTVQTWLFRKKPIICLIVIKKTVRVCTHTAVVANEPLLVDLLVPD